MASGTPRLQSGSVSRWYRFAGAAQSKPPFEPCILGNLPLSAKNPAEFPNGMICKHNRWTPMFSPPPMALTAWLAGPAAAQGIGTWSNQRSPYPVATSEHFDELRGRVERDFPNARFVPLHTLPASILVQLDVLILDGQGTTR
jgi:hypothetical protein